MTTSVRRDRDRLAVTWHDGSTDEFHYVWLRDNCPCPDCRDPDAWERRFDTVALAPDVAPRGVQVGDGLLLEWPDGHVTPLSEGWLRDHAYGAVRRGLGVDASVRWDASIANAPPEVTFSEVHAGDDGLLRWLRLIRDYGFALVRDVPCEREAVAELAERIGFVQESNFGRTFEVVSKPQPENLAFTAQRLFVHTDIPNRHSAVNLQLLHCLENSADGGESLLTDGFEAARQLATSAPEAYELLRSVAVPWRYQDRVTDIVNRFPVIRTDDQGRPVEIRFSTALMAPLDLDAELVVPFYDALRSFGRLVRDPRLEYRFRLAPGDCLIFDNQRVLHGREAFDPSSGRRHLQGCYVDKDDALGRLRALERGLRGSPVG